MEELSKISLDQPVNPVTNNEMPKESLMNENVSKKSKLGTIVVILAVILGVTTGIFLAQRNLLLATDAGPTPMTQNPTDAGSVKVGDTFGAKDEKSFRDNVQGILQPGGISGEGSHHLERGADKSQWVYLTSSVVDLDNFVGSKVEIWGETFQGKKAGWLMDVGKLKVLELNAAPAAVNQVEE